MQESNLRLEKELLELRKEVADCRTNVAKIWDFLSSKGEVLHGLSKLSTGSIPSLRYPQPVSFQESASGVPESTVAAAPSPISATSNVSSSSSNFHLGSLMLDSPHSQLATLPVAGPSRIGRAPQAQGTLFRYIFIHGLTNHTCLLSSQHPDSCCAVNPNRGGLRRGHHQTLQWLLGPGSRLAIALALEHLYHTISAFMCFYSIMYTRIPSLC